MGVGVFSQSFSDPSLTDRLSVLLARSVHMTARAILGSIVYLHQNSPQKIELVGV